MPDYFDETFVVEASNWEEARELGHAKKNRRYEDGLFELFGKREPVQVSVRIHKETASETKPKRLAKLTTIVFGLKRHHCRYCHTMHSLQPDHRSQKPGTTAKELTISIKQNQSKGVNTILDLRTNLYLH